MEKTEKVMENHGIFCNLKSMNPVTFVVYIVYLCPSKDHLHPHVIILLYLFCVLVECGGASHSFIEKFWIQN